MFEISGFSVLHSQLLVSLWLFMVLQRKRNIDNSSFPTMLDYRMKKLQFVKIKCGLITDILNSLEVCCEYLSDILTNYLNRSFMVVVKPRFTPIMRPNVNNVVIYYYEFHMISVILII